MPEKYYPQSIAHIGARVGHFLFGVSVLQRGVQASLRSRKVCRGEMIGEGLGESDYRCYESDLRLAPCRSFASMR